MVSFTQLYENEKKRLAQAIGGQADATAALDAVRACLDRMRQDYIAAEDSPLLRQEAMRLMDAAKAAAGVLLGATGTEISLRLKSPALYQPAQKGKWLRYVPLVLCALTFVALLREGLWLVLLAGAATAASVWQTFFAKDAPAVRELPEATGTVRVDAQAVATQVEALCVTCDRMLSEYGERLSARGEMPHWTQEQLAAVQMLWEAIHAGDSVYALKAAPALLDSLERQDVRLLTYTDDASQYFDRIPGEAGGITIRPALLSGAMVLSRGQVTVPMRTTAEVRRQV